MAVVKHALPTDPQWLKSAFADVGIKEIVGKKHNPKVVQYYKDSGHGWVKNDEVAWCMAFVNAHLMRAGQPHTNSLAARSGLTWGAKTTKPKRGDLVIFTRGRSTWQVHIGFFIGFSADKRYVYVVDGNASNSVKISRRAVNGQNKVLGYRTPTTVANSRTLKAGLAGGASGLVALASEGREIAYQLQEGATMSGYSWAIVGAGVVGAICAAVILYARWDDWKKKGV